MYSVIGCRSSWLYALYLLTNHLPQYWTLFAPCANANRRSVAWCARKSALFSGLGRSASFDVVETSSRLEVRLWPLYSLDLEDA
jgi:hypothetical protein